MAKDITAKGYLSGNITANAGLSGDITASGTLGQTVILESLPIYDGVTEVTPSTQMQVLPVRNKTVTDNIIINPIPSNYGLVAWNGSTLTVS